MSNAIVLSKDGPIKTLQEAVDRSRATGCHRIVVESGVYYGSSVVLDERDNGLVLEGDGNGRATLSGSVKVSGFEYEAETGFLVKQLDENFSTDFRMLYANGKYLKKARFPKEGTLTHQNEWDVPWMSTFGDGWKRKPTHEELTTLIYTPEEIPADFRFRNAEMIIFHDWDESFVGVESMNPEQHTFTLSSECGHPPAAFFHHEYIIYNTVEGMTEPLQWYLDKDERKIRIFPEDGMTPENLTVLVPMTQSVIKMDGCKNITIQNIDFSGCTSPLGAAEFGAQRVPGAIDGFDVDRVLLDGVSVSYSGGMGARFTGTNITVQNSNFDHLGAGGIWVGINDEYLYTSYEEQEQECSSLVQNCTVHHTGMDYFASIALFSRHTRVIKNRVYHTPYSGISIGGDHVVADGNVISDTMRELNDGAALYTIGYSEGAIRNNIIFDLPAGTEKRKIKPAIYLDEHSKNWIVENNYVRGCKAPFNHHMNATGIVVRNNVATNSTGDMVFSCVRCEDILFTDNVFVCDGDLKIVATKGMTHTLKNNLIELTGKTLWQEDVHYVPEEPFEFMPDDSNTIVHK